MFVSHGQGLEWVVCLVIVDSTVAKTESFSLPTVSDFILGSLPVVQITCYFTTEDIVFTPRGKMIKVVY